MGLRKRGRLVLILVPIILALIVASSVAPTTNSINSISDHSALSHEKLGNELPITSYSDRAFALSQDNQVGIIDPTQIKESGFLETDTVRARTDTGLNTDQNITIDDGNNWLANTTEIEVWNFKELFGVNGTFEDGVDPWTSYTYDGGSNTQTASYDSDGEYIVCRNEGEDKGGGEYLHKKDSEIGWEQTISNPDGKLTFKLKLDYRFATGPIDPDGDDGFLGYIALFFQVNDGSTYDTRTFPLETTVDSREDWYSLSRDFTLPSPWSGFDIVVGLIMVDDLTLYSSNDYDDDPLGLPDGTTHAKNLTLYLDNVEFTSNDVPTFESMELTFHAGVFSEAITGSGIGTATISNPSYWSTNPLNVSITSNTTVVFTYSVTTLYHRYVNSSWITDPTKHGVSYSIDSGQSANLAFFKYVTSSTGYLNSTIDIEYPQDWENVTVWDPFLTNVTNLCLLSSGSIHVPHDELDRVGWWEFELQTPNYAEGISVQIQDGASWSDSSIFNSGNTTRVQVEIGTATETPLQKKPVNVTWTLPNGTEWASDSTTTMIGGIVNSSSFNLDGANTSAGQWEVEIFWSNGTEVAFDNTVFDMYHTASLTPREGLVETDVGLTFTNMMYYVDEDTGDYVVDLNGVVVANWSISTITFQVNQIHNWWEADFNTSAVGGGTFTVVVNASIPYYNDVSCQFTIEATYTTSFGLPGIGPTPIDLGLNEKYIVNITYAFSDGTGITGAAIDFSYTGQVLGLSNSTPNDLGGGNYSLEITGLLSGDYSVTISASKENFYAQSDQFSLSVGETGTTLSGLNGTADIIPFGGTFHLILYYTNSSGFGLSSATVEVVDTIPSSGLVPGSSTNEGNGYYSFDLTPSIADTYTLVIKANLTNHESKFFTFNLLVTDISTVLYPDTSGKTIAVDRNHTVQLTYEDEFSNGITGADVTLVDVPPGLSYVILELGSGIYNVTLIPSVSEVTSFDIAFQANLTNYQTSTTVFSLFVQMIPTDLTVIDSSTIDSILITDVYTVTIAYIRTDTGANISSADISVSSTPSVGLNPTIQYIGDVYELSFLFDGLGIWQIIVSANRSSFVTSLVQLEVEVNPIDTSILGLNGTAGLVEFGGSYSLSLRYTNSTGAGILGALIQIAEVTPASGIGYGTVVDEGDGYYSIVFTPTVADTFSIVIRANFTRHVVQYLSFSLVVIPIETTLTPHETQATIALDHNYTLQLNFIDDRYYPVTGADIIVVNPPSGLTYIIEDVGNGIYNATIIPSVTETTSFQMSFRANLTNYQSSTAAFTLLVQIIPTELVILDGEATESILFMEEYSLTICYIRTDTNESISFADIVVFTTPTDGPKPAVTTVGDEYHLTFIGNQTGKWQVTINAIKTHHVIGALHLELEVILIDTNLNDIILVESLVYGREYNFNFSYVKQGGMGVIGAQVTISGSAVDWAYVEEIGSGQYTISLTPESVGSYEVTLTFKKEGFVSRTSTLEFDVDAVTMSVVDVQGLTALEGYLTTISLRLIDRETGAVVSGATVTYQLIVDIVPTSTEVLLESDSTPGEYSSTFIMPSYDSEAKIRIYIDINYHQLENQEGYIEADLTPTASDLTTLTRTFTLYSPFILLAGILVTGYSGRRFYNQRKRRENIEALAIKRRFDDVRNMLGVVVLHSKSGLPIYSRMVKGGFDESMLSAFITAISSFRSEFDASPKEWEISPISDIIMAVRTQNLICAFITMGSPTKTQEERIIQFAKAVGSLFDIDFEVAPTLTIDDMDESRFDELFDEMLDMHLYRKHMIVDTKGFPRGPKCLNTAISELQEAESFELEEMAKKMAACGLEEAKVYKIIMDAITNLQIVPIMGMDIPVSTHSSDAVEESETIPIDESDTIEDIEE